MSDKIQKKIDYFTQLVNQILVLSTGGIAAGVAFLQVDGITGGAVTFTIVSLLLFVISLIAGVFGLTTIIGQADEEKPDFNQCVVKWPNLIALLFFVFGIISFLTGSLVHYAKSDKSEVATKSEPATTEATTCPTFEVNESLFDRLKRALLG